MSYGLYVGANHTRDGHAWLAGYGDEPSSHWLEIVPRRTHDAGATITVGATPGADMPGVLSKIPQKPETFRHIRVSYSYYKGVPAPLTNGGLNEHGVAVRDIWSTSRRELIDMTPKDQHGPNYSDLARCVLERARTAEEGVELIRALIAEHGYTTYGGNSHIIADPAEAWVVIECAGGQGLWVAERLGAEDIRASRPGYIGEIDISDEKGGTHRFSRNFISFAISQDWFDPDAGKAFNVNEVYGDGKGRWDGVKWIESEMAGRAGRPEKIGLDDVMWAVRTEKLTGDTAGYGQVVPLHHPGHTALRHLWHTQTGAIAAPFVPVFMGVREVPEEFRMHRYLTAGEEARFLDVRHMDDEPDSLSRVPQGIESTRSATAVFKRLLNLVLQHQEIFLAETTAVWEAREAKLRDQCAKVLKTTEILLAQSESELAADVLTYFTSTELRGALQLAETLADAMEARTRALHGIRTDPTPLAAEQIW